MFVPSWFKDYGYGSVEMFKGSITIGNKQTDERLPRIANEDRTSFASAIVSDGFNELCRIVALDAGRVISCDREIIGSRPKTIDLIA